MWWSPDSKKIAFYRFDEKHGARLLPAARPDGDPGHARRRGVPESRRKPNPVVDLLVYDVATKKTTDVDVRDGKPFDNDVVGHYVYNVSLVARRQGAALQPHEPPAEHDGVRRLRPRDGKCRVIVREEWPTELDREHARRCAS